MQRPAKLAPERVWLPDEECERLRRTEFEAVRCLLGAVNYAVIAKRDLEKRMGMIPDGMERISKATQALRDLADDVVGTIPVGQCRQIRNTMDDMEIRIVPKLSSRSQNVLLEKELARGLFDAAMDKCHGCVEDAQGCRKCPLYKVLEGALPLDKYDTMLCPYSISEWED